MTLTIFLELLSKYWQYCVITLLALTIGYFKMSNDRLSAEKDKVIAEHSATISQFDTLKLKTQECNQTVDDLNKKGIELQTRVNEANKTIESLEVKNRSIIREIKTGIVPKDCNEAVKYLIKNIKKNTANWEKS
ncbi:MAG: hypothetical protein HQK52_19305 [Oligoflexia bacterium]|nr:hypothetical protein [Oligoflexia bacterium]